MSMADSIGTLVQIGEHAIYPPSDYGFVAVVPGGFVDSNAVERPPAPWEIIVALPPLFTDCEMSIPVPHTYFVQVKKNPNPAYPVS